MVSTVRIVQRTRTITTRAGQLQLFLQQLQQEQRVELLLELRCTTELQRVQCALHQQESPHGILGTKNFHNKEVMRGLWVR